MFLDCCICQLLKICKLSWFILSLNKYTPLYLIFSPTIFILFPREGSANCINLGTHTTWICPILRYNFFGLNWNLVAGWDPGNTHAITVICCFIMTHACNFDLGSSFNTDGIILRSVEVHVVSLAFPIWLKLTFVLSLIESHVIGSEEASVQSQLEISDVLMVSPMSELVIPASHCFKISFLHSQRFGHVFPAFCW